MNAGVAQLKKRINKNISVHCTHTKIIITLKHIRKLLIITENIRKYIKRQLLFKSYSRYLFSVSINSIQH